MKLKLILLAGLFAFGYAMSANAGAVQDTDNDLVPDGFDNCSALANGPNEAPSNQYDIDTDGYGNRCDPDYDNDGDVDLADFNTFVSFFGSTGTPSATDTDGDDDTDLTDFNNFVAFFGGVPGPSGLSCAGTVPCTP